MTQQRTDQTQQTMSSVPKTTVPATEKPNDLPKLKRFVDPWPENKPYLNKSGNALSAEFEKAFEAFCFKCGHFSHKAKIAEFILTQQLSLLYVLNVDKGFMMNANLGVSSILNKMLVNCKVIFKEMVFGISIHRTLCGGDLTT